MNDEPNANSDEHTVPHDGYQQALASLERVLTRFEGCSDDEKQLLRRDLEQLNQIMGTQIEPILAEPRAGDVKHSQADITAARENLGYEPEPDITDQLKQTADWFTSSMQA